MKFFLKTRTFSRLANKSGISDESLRQAVAELEKGLFDANLGGNIYKKRVAVGNKGKRGGSRTIIATNLNDRWFFVFCFLKKDMDNIDNTDLENFKELAKILLNLSDEKIRLALSAGKLEEIQ